MTALAVLLVWLIVLGLIIRAFNAADARSKRLSNERAEADLHLRSRMARSAIRREAARQTRLLEDELREMDR